MKKIIKVNPKSTRQYLQLFNGILRLTDRELSVLTAFIDKVDEVEGIDPFSTPMRRKISEELDITEGLLNNYVKALKDKRVIRKINGKYEFADLVLRKEDETGVEFNWGK